MSKQQAYCSICLDIWYWWILPRHARLTLDAAWTCMDIRPSYILDHHIFLLHLLAEVLVQALFCRLRMSCLLMSNKFYRTSSHHLKTAEPLSGQGTVNPLMTWWSLCLTDPSLFVPKNVCHRTCAPKPQLVEVLKTKIPSTSTILMLWCCASLWCRNGKHAICRIDSLH